MLAPEDFWACCDNNEDVTTNRKITTQAIDFLDFKFTRRTSRKMRVHSAPGTPSYSSMINESFRIARLAFRLQFRLGRQMMNSKKQGIGHHASASAPRKTNFCFGCGKDNASGMHLKFSVDETGKRFVCRFHLAKRYTGPPGHCHG